MPPSPSIGGPVVYFLLLPEPAMTEAGCDDRESITEDAQTDGND